MTDTTEVKQEAAEASGKKGFFSSLFNCVSYLKSNWKQPATIVTASLLAGTALSAPFLSASSGSIMGLLAPGALMAASLYLLKETSDVVCDNAETLLGDKIKLGAITVGAILGGLTSLPELFVGVNSIITNQPAIGLGTIIGSNIYNTLLILGLTAAIAAIPPATGMSWKFNTMSMLGATAAFGGMVVSGATLPVAAGVALLGGLVAYAVSSAIIDRRDQKAKTEAGIEDAEDDEEESELFKMPAAFNALWGTAGVAGLIASSNLLVSSSATFAHNAGASDALIAALIVAGGTSLPELMVNVNFALRKNTQAAVGNILGSNIFNILMIGGVLAAAGSAIDPNLTWATGMGKWSMSFYGGSAIALGAALWANKGGLTRMQGIAGLAAYLVYAGVMVNDMVKNYVGTDKPAQESSIEDQSIRVAYADAPEIIENDDAVLYVPPMAAASVPALAAP